MFQVLNNTENVDCLPLHLNQNVIYQQIQWFNRNLESNRQTRKQNDKQIDIQRERVLVLL